MCHGDFTRLRIAAAACQARVGYRMVGRAEWPGSDKGFLCRQKTHNRIDLTDLQGFLPGHIRQDRWQPLRQHAFTGTGRTDQQYIMTAGRCHFQSPLHIFLPKNILEIQCDTIFCNRLPEWLFCQNGLSVQTGSKFRNRADWDNLGASGKGGLRRIFRRNHQTFYTLFFCSQCHGQNTGNRPDTAIQSHFTKKGGCGFRAPHTAGSGQYAD